MTYLDFRLESFTQPFLVALFHSDGTIVICLLCVPGAQKHLNYAPGSLFLLYVLSSLSLCWTIRQLGTCLFLSSCQCFIPDVLDIQSQPPLFLLCICVCVCVLFDGLVWPSESWFRFVSLMNSCLSWNMDRPSVALPQAAPVLHVLHFLQYTAT